MRFFVILLLPLLIAAPRPVWAQTDDARAYLEAAKARGIDTDIAYLDADAPLPELGVPPPPPPEPRRAIANSDGDAERTVIIAIAALALLGALWAATRFGGARAASFAQAPDAGLRHRPGPAAPPRPRETLDLARIAAIADRRAALEALWLAALSRAAAAHGLTIGRSWTARDALARVPGAWPHRAALARLARAAELANFGGRDVPEDQFHALLDAAAPIFAGRKA